MRPMGRDDSDSSPNNSEENFWPASAPSQGPDGVCGPCSEIYYHAPGGKGTVEIWNLVFTQFNRVGPPPDNLRPLPKRNIDTGMGLDRTAAVLQGVESNFENDILKPLCLAAGEAVGCGYEFTAPQGRALRRIADHVRVSAGTLVSRSILQPGTYTGFYPFEEHESWRRNAAALRRLAKGKGKAGKKDA